MCDAMIAMNKEETIWFQNPRSLRGTIYALVIAILTSTTILLLGFFLEEEIMVTGIFSAVPFLFVVVGYLADSFKNAIRIGIGPQGIQFVYKGGKKEVVPWKNIVSLKSTPLDPGFYNLSYLKENGKVSLNVLSEGLAEQVSRMLKEQCLDVRNFDSEPKIE